MAANPLPSGKMMKNGGFGDDPSFWEVLKLTYVQERLLLFLQHPPYANVDFCGFPVNGYVQITVFFHQQHANAYSFCANEWDSLDFEGP